jgi:hypothetical protein
LSDRKFGSGIAAPVEVGDAAFGKELVERAFVLGQARHHHRRHQRLAVVAAQFHQFAVRVGAAHVAGAAVAVHVFRHPVRVALLHAVVDRAAAHVAAALEHLFGTVGRQARHDVEQRLAQRLRPWARPAAGRPPWRRRRAAR